MVCQHKASKLMLEYIYFNGKNSDEINDWINSRKCRISDHITATISRLERYHLIDVFSHILVYENFYDFCQDFETLHSNKVMNGVSAFTATNKDSRKEYTVIIYREDSPFYQVESYYEPEEMINTVKLYSKDKKSLLLMSRFQFSREEVDNLGIGMLVNYHKVKHGDVFLLSGVDNEVRKISIEQLMKYYVLKNTNIQTMMLDPTLPPYYKYSMRLGDIMDLLIVHDFNIYEVRDKFQELLKKPVECKILPNFEFEFKWNNGEYDEEKTLTVNNNEIIGGFFNVMEPMVDKIDFNLIFKG